MGSGVAGDKGALTLGAVLAAQVTRHPLYVGERRPDSGIEFVEPEIGGDEAGHGGSRQPSSSRVVAQPTAPSPKVQVVSIQPELRVPRQASQAPVMIAARLTLTATTIARNTSVVMAHRPARGSAP